MHPMHPTPPPLCLFSSRHLLALRLLIPSRACVSCVCACACAAAGGELTVSDLIAGLGDSRSKLGAARKVLEKKAAPVAAPLPGPILQRQERKAG